MNAPSGGERENSCSRALKAQRASTQMVAVPKASSASKTAAEERSTLHGLRTDRSPDLVMRIDEAVFIIVLNRLDEMQ